MIRRVVINRIFTKGSEHILQPFRVLTDANIFSLLPIKLPVVSTSSVQVCYINPDKKFGFAFA